MINLADLLAQAQNGSAFENMARHYGLSAEQSRKVVEAFLPAFASAFKRKAAEPAAVPDLMGLMSGEAYAKAFETAQAAFTPQTRDAGNEALAALFGSKDVSRAVADQMAAYSGVGASVLKSMLPVLTSMTMGGMGNALKMPAADGNPLMALMNALGGANPAMGGAMGGLAGMVQSALAGVAPQVMTDVMRQAGLSTIDKSGAALREAVGDVANPAGPDTPLGDLLGAYVQGYNRGRPAPEPPPPPEPEAFDPAKMMGDLFSQMLSAGQSAQGDHANAVEQILDRLMSPKR
jgi:hypothetical protein